MIQTIISGGDLGGETIKIADTMPINAEFTHLGLCLRYVGEVQAVYLGLEGA